MEELDITDAGRGFITVVPGAASMDSAMDLVAGSRRIVIEMTHQARGAAKKLLECTLPLTAVRRVDMVVTEMAVVEPTKSGLILREYPQE